MPNYDHKQIKKYSIEQLQEFISSGQIHPNSGPGERIMAELSIRRDKKNKMILSWTVIAAIAAIIAAIVGIISLFIQT